MTHDNAIDLGADGPAAIARAVRNATIAGRAVGSIRTEKTVVRRVVCECTLDTLHAQHHLQHGEATPATADLRYKAGLRFRQLWLSSARRARVVADLTGSPARGSVQDGLAAGSDARSIVNAATKALGDQRITAVVSVCGEDESARGKLMWLCRGLDALVELWGLAAVKSPPK